MIVAELDEELLEPRAEDLAEALRAFGYDLPTALADLVDNSITARARTVRVEYCSDPGSAWLAVVDDGEGMSSSQLRNAMRFAGNPNNSRTAGDLGRFGLGLKTASLSQARKLTVLSRSFDGALACMTWDLGYINRHKQWLVITQVDAEALTIASLLGFDHQGTVVLWRHTDKLGEGPELRRRVTGAGKELSLLFHRFMADGRLSLSVGQHRLRPMDPYLRRNPLTQDRGIEELEHEGQRITVNPVVLPHPSRMSREEGALASGPGGLLARQGFYVYRDDRLIVAGGWLGMVGMHNSAPTRLARIAVEIPPSADLAWEVDVRKSTVRPPEALAGRIAELAADVRARSERVFTHRGTPAPSQLDDRDVQAVWRQVRRLGRYEYTVNREHPLVAAALSGDLGLMVEGIIRMIETTLPVDLISRKPAAAEPLGGNEVGAGSEVEEVLTAFRAMLAGLPLDPEERSGLAEALASAEPFNRFPGLIQEVIDSNSAEEC
jgi:Histidine kinase-, DNA gyrase B-, and HSP90-like ATPase